MFLWRVRNNLLRIKENIFRISVLSDPQYCPICGLEVETVNHILWSCPSTRDVWGTSICDEGNVKQM